jgi:hypothetical protein
LVFKSKNTLHIHTISYIWVNTKILSKYNTGENGPEVGAYSPHYEIHIKKRILSIYLNHSALKQEKNSAHF